MHDIWYSKLGFSRNPFSIKPAAFSFDLLGSNSLTVISGIDEGKVFFVEAPLGFGKTTLLKGIVSRYGGRRKVIYAHALPSEKLDVKGLLKRSSLANYLTGNLPVGMILVVDEAQNLLPESAAEISEFYSSGNIRAVVFFGTKYLDAAFAGNFGKVINGNLVRLVKPTPEQAISIVRSRVGNLSLLSDEQIRSAYRMAKGSPRRLLQICEDLCRASAEGRTYVQKAAKRPRKARKTAVKVESMPEIVGEISATPAAPVVKVVKRKRAAKSVEPRKRRKAPEQKKQPPEEAPQEGVYWGEFMGMQK